MFCIGCSLFSVAQAETWPPKKPKLVVVIVIDQFRADYLSPFQNKFGKNGFRALVDDGAYFPFGEYDLLQSMTAPGHATILTGAYPYQMGIPLNDWYDQKTKAEQYCVEDRSAQSVNNLGMNFVGRSPRNLVGTTLGDELKNADIPSRVFAIALKDRASILLGGHRADLALWYERKAKSWVSSDYYLKDRKLPDWVNELNQQIPEDECDTATSCGLILTGQAAEVAVDKLKLGAENTLDVLAISFSSHDFAGHAHGPNAPIMETMTLTEDKVIESLRKKLDRKVPGGLKNVLFVLTGDHGIPPTADYLKDTGIESGRIVEKDLVEALESALTKKFGKRKKSWISFVSDLNFYLDEEAILASKIKIEDVEAEAKRTLQKNPSFAFVFTRSDVERRQLPPAMFERKILKTYFPGRSGHIIAVPKPFFAISLAAVTHMTAYSYDRTVPILFSGFGIRKGTYAGKAEVVDIAPTLSFMLGIVPPALSEGRVLGEALKAVSK